MKLGRIRVCWGAFVNATASWSAAVLSFHYPQLCEAGRANVQRPVFAVILSVVFEAKDLAIRPSGYGRPRSLSKLTARLSNAGMDVIRFD